jgi:hypothetical protein
MAEKIDAAAEVEQEAETVDERAHVVTLNKPFVFEKTEIKEIDLGGLDNMTIQDAISVQAELFGQQEVASSLLCETTSAFAMAIACRASGLPIEFFKKLPIGAGRQVKRYVQQFIRRTNEGEGTVLRLQAPYTFHGEVFQEFDLSPIANMSMMQESAAENVMAREGFIITENSFNYLYACVIAGMAVNKPKELFTGLPLRELLNLKEAVNNSDFFE